MLISYELLGKLFVYLVIAVIIVTGIALLFGAYSIRKHKIIFPNYILFMLYLFYSPAKWICRIFSIKEEIQFPQDIQVKEVDSPPQLFEYINVKTPLQKRT